MYQSNKIKKNHNLEKLAEICKMHIPQLFHSVILTKQIQYANARQQNMMKQEKMRTHCPRLHGISFPIVKGVNVWFLAGHSTGLGVINFIRNVFICFIFTFCYIITILLLREEIMSNRTDRKKLFLLTDVITLAAKRSALPE